MQGNEERQAILDSNEFAAKSPSKKQKVGAGEDSPFSARHIFKFLYSISDRRVLTSLTKPSVLTNLCSVMLLAAKQAEGNCKIVL